jgi:lysozyme family protein
MTKSSFEVCLNHTLQWEGNFSNHKEDTGGPTMRGIIQRVYDAWRKRNNLPRRSVRAIEEAELQAIYRENYWALVRGDELPEGLDLCVFDYGVNSGPSRAVSHLQEILNIKVDGNMGPVTLDAVNAADPVDTIKKLSNRRRKFVRQIVSYPTFGVGWERRIDGVEQVCSAMCSEPVRSIPVVPIADLDAQSESQGRATEVKPPISNTTKAVAAAAGGGAVAKGGEALITAPPANVTDTVANVDMWSKVGKAATTMADGLWKSPVFAASLFAVAIAVIWGPTVWAKVKGS